MRGIGTVSFVVSSVSCPFPLPFLFGLGEGSSYPDSFFIAKGGDIDGREGIVGRP